MISRILAFALLALALSACSTGTREPEVVEQTPVLENGSYFADLNGFEIHYEVHGTGPVVMTVPNSWGLSLEGLRAMYRPLEERVTMVYFDPRGMGRSGSIVEDSDMGMEAVRADFDALRRHLGLDRVHAIGWSNGAINLLFLASEKPEILESAILVHGAAKYGQEEMVQFAERFPEMMAKYEAFMAEMADESLTDEERTARQRQLWIGEWFPAITGDPDAMRDVIAQTFANADLSWPHARYSRESMPNFDLTDRLPEIAVRTLVIAGAHDSIPLSAAELMREAIPGAEMAVFENSGHFAPLEETERFRGRVYEFLGV